MIIHVVHFITYIFMSVHVTNSVPECIVNISSLERLDLTNNDLTG